MCGIIAVLRRRSDRLPPTPTSSAAGLAAAVVDRSAGGLTSVAALVAAAGRARGAPNACSGACPASVACSPAPTSPPPSTAPPTGCGARRRHRGELDDGVLVGASSSRRRTPPSSASRTRPGRSSATASAPPASSASSPAPAPAPAAVEAYTSIQVALSALDRLEVRGRDSAGLHLLVREPRPRPRVVGRRAPSSATGGATTCSAAAPSARPTGMLSLVYKAAAEIGELGDNTRALRAAIAGDELLRAALRSPDAEVTVLGHTRWASVGIISQANAHPLNSEEEGVGRTGDGDDAAVRHRRAQRRRRQPRRPQGRRTACASRPTSPPTPRSSRPS